MGVNLFLHESLPCLTDLMKAYPEGMFTLPVEGPHNIGDGLRQQMSRTWSLGCGHRKSKVRLNGAELATSRRAQAGRGPGPGMRGAGREEQGASPVPVHLFFSPLTTTTPPQGLAPCWQSAGTKLPPELMNQ